MPFGVAVGPGAQKGAIVKAESWTPFVSERKAREATRPAQHGRCQRGRRDGRLAFCYHGRAQ